MEEGRESDVGAEGGSGMGNRLKAYKYKRMDVKEMRRHREEEGLQLRKQKKDELVCTDEFKKTLLLITFKRSERKSIAARRYFRESFTKISCRKIESFQNFATIFKILAKIVISKF